MEKCLHVLPMNKLSGAEKMALLICKNLKSYEPIVICGGEVLKKVFEENGIKAYAVDFSKKNAIKAMRTIRDVIMVNKVKIVHAHDNNASIYSYLSKRLFSLNVKVISHIHSCYPFLKSNGLNKKADSLFRPKYDFNILCGKEIEGYYKEYTNYLPENKTICMSNAIDSFKSEISKEAADNLKSSLGIANKIVLGYVGRLCDIKGTLSLIEEIGKNKNLFSNCKILMVGSGEDEAKAKLLVESFKMKELFIFTGFEENPQKYYEIMDIFFLPSRYEGLPMVALEAMSYGVPVVSMKVGSVGELLNDGRGVLVNRGDYREFIIKLCELKNSRSDILNRGKLSKAFVDKNYNMDDYINKLQSQYSSLTMK